jgi:hypothetical protein
LGTVGAFLGITVGIAPGIGDFRHWHSHATAAQCQYRLYGDDSRRALGARHRLCVGMLATVAAAIFPASRVARTPVADALRQNHFSV